MSAYEHNDPYRDRHHDDRDDNRVEWHDNNFHRVHHGRGCECRECRRERVIVIVVPEERRCSDHGRGCRCPQCIIRYGAFYQRDCYGELLPPAFIPPPPPSRAECLYYPTYTPICPPPYSPQCPPR